jgi:hypothetical protein
VSYQIDKRHLDQHRLDQRCLQRDDASSNRYPAVAHCRIMIFSESRYSLFGSRE